MEITLISVESKVDSFYRANLLQFQGCYHMCRFSNFQSSINLFTIFIPHLKHHEQQYSCFPLPRGTQESHWC